jgi:hypothetical protein
VRLAALVLAASALALTGCESTQEKSAKLQRAAERQPGHAQVAPAKSLSIAHASSDVKVVSATVIHGSEGNAAAVVLKNETAKTLVGVPIAIAVKSAAGATVYTNSTSGLAHTLVAVPSLAPHGQVAWVDDQVEASGTPASVSAEVGEAPASSGTLPNIAVRGARLVREPTGESAEGTVVNGSGVAQSDHARRSRGRGRSRDRARTRGGRLARVSAVLPRRPCGRSSQLQRARQQRGLAARRRDPAARTVQRPFNAAGGAA